MKKLRWVEQGVTSIGFICEVLQMPSPEQRTVHKPEVALVIPRVFRGISESTVPNSCRT